MDNENRIANLSEEKYLVTFGIRKPTFDKMLEILEGAYKREHAAGGHPPRLNVLDKLVVTLGYYHDYRTMENIAFDYSVSKSRIRERLINSMLISLSLFICSFHYANKGKENTEKCSLAFFSVSLAMRLNGWKRR